jgi:hypothetical protein
VAQNPSDIHNPNSILLIKGGTADSGMHGSIALIVLGGILILIGYGLFHVPKRDLVVAGVILSLLILVFATVFVTVFRDFLRTRMFAPLVVTIDNWSWPRISLLLNEGC